MGRERAMNLFQCNGVDECFHRAGGWWERKAPPPLLQLSLQLATQSEIGKEREREPIGLELDYDIMHLATIAGITGHPNTLISV